MNIKDFEPVKTLSISVVREKPSGSPITVILQPGSEQAALGEPGKSAGSLIVNRADNGEIRLIVSTGLPAKATPETLRQTGGLLARWLVDNKVSSALIDADSISSPGGNNALAGFCEGLLLGSYQFVKYRKNKPANLVNLYLLSKEPAGLSSMLSDIEKTCYAVNLARQIIHEPANVINPETLSELARDLANEYGLKCTVYDSAQLQEMKAGALLAVGKGSKTPSRLIVLEYPGQGGSTAKAPVALVGKAITFDTGGYSLKSTEHILGMKYDKAGGVSVLATLITAASLKLPQPLVGVIPAAENMISGGSYRPDDILTSMSGKTIEIVSTDAEGRLILADALTFTQKTFKPAALIDMATLTGGVIIALGHVRAGILANDDELCRALLKSGEQTYERLWQLPLDEEYNELIKSHEADMRNSGPREASTIMGGIFLKQFIEDGTRWAHLDIAGTGDVAKDMPYCPAGPTGFGIRLLINYLKQI
ncbi:MAG: leucyl aminopeptidase [Anaerolineae bacterium]|nr:leucyl aminopeptidase [Anaerolineae bacterium]